MFDFMGNDIINYYKKIVNNREIAIEKQKEVIKSYKETSELQSKMIAKLDLLFELKTKETDEAKRKQRESEKLIQSQKAYIASLELQTSIQASLIEQMERIIKLS